MKRISLLIIAAGTALMAVLAGTFGAREVMAQVKAALVRSVDEPGRVPFSQDVVSSCNISNCFSDFDVVPAGKRLVIQHVGGLARPNSTASVFSFAELDTNSTTNPGNGVRNHFPMTLIGPAGTNISFNTWGFNQPVKAYVEAGNRASVTMDQQNQGAVLFAQVSISGYLVDVIP